MSLLLIDAGNTHVKFVTWSGFVEVPNFRAGKFIPPPENEILTVLGTVPTEILKNTTEFENQISKIARGPFGAVILVSVIPPAEKILKMIFPQLQGVGKNGKYPFPHDILHPETVGPDRFCNMAAAVFAGLSSALVVDVGTATTFDLLLDGVFKGGLIAPGMAFAAGQLARRGAMLDEVPFEVRPALVGNNTHDAMIGGAWLNGCGGVEWTIARLLETYGDLPVVLTGGLSEMLPSDERYVDPWWTLRGAAVLAEKALLRAEPTV